MARFLTAAWVEEFNAALDGTVLPGPDSEAGLVASDGRFTVAQEVRGTPDGDLRVLLRADDGSLRLWLEPPGDPEPGAEPDGTVPDVTIVITYDDAVALSQGHLVPAEALNAGRIRVRGDLSVLAAAQQMLVAARVAAGDLAASTTY
jgi:putative sterol carrier protein